MNSSGDVAESIIRMSLNGLEVAAKISGSGAKNISVLLYTILKDQEQTKGKTKLINMLKSGKELKVFSLRKEDLKIFTKESKRYGVLFSALIDKKLNSHDGMVDIMVKAEDASKINRIVDRFNLSSYNDVSIKSEIEKTKKSMDKDDTLKNVVLEEISDKSLSKEKQEILNPNVAKTEKSPLSEPLYKSKKNVNVGTKCKKPSVKEELEKIKSNLKMESNLVTNNKEVENKKVNKITKHTQPKLKKKKPKERS
jgi:hypothetical protein